MDEAILRYHRILALAPDYAGVHINLGTALCEQGKLDEAEASYRLALTLAPGDAEAHNNLGTVLRQKERLDEAVACYRQALTLRRGYAEAHNNLGTALAALGKLEEAQSSYRMALALKPDYVAARVHLGTVLWEQGKLDEAASAYRRALESNPEYTDALDRLAAVTMLLGDPGLALNTVWRSLQIAETENARRIFVDIVKKVQWTSCDNRIRTAVCRAMAEPWARPGELAKAAADLVRLTPGTGGCITRAAQAWPRPLTAAELFGPDGPGVLSGDPLLCGLLCSTQNMDIGLERFLTLARRLLLQAAASKEGDAQNALSFYSALAQQCFINEYVFALADDELRQAEMLRDAMSEALAAGLPVLPLQVIAVAAYFPLFTLPHSALLADRQWPAPVAALVAQQITEPRQEETLRTAMPRLTPVENQFSRSVRDHYENTPYPRWVRTEVAQNPVTIAEYMNGKFPLASFRRDSVDGGAQILSAGCGTGVAAIELATAVKDAHLLAVDLSLHSLCYAKRKAQELGVPAVDFAQADILELGSLAMAGERPERFDIIECSGVLHHMADAFAGWRMLLPLLRPGGFMLIGLYSQTARQAIVRTRQVIADRGFGVSADDIRRCRQELLECGDSENLGPALANSDFFGTSTCRDLLFHCQELRMTLDGIAAFLRENSLTFLGFEMEDNVLGAYRKRFPGDQAATDLNNWQVFEQENPNTFSAMYMMWVQKAA